MKNRVLLIDDDALTYSKLNNILNVFENSFDFKIKLDYARTLSDATTLLKNKKYDLMILDYFMHENTTESFLFNTKEKYPNLKINIITSIRDYAILKKLLKFGVSRIIYKPLSLLNVIENIRENLFTTNLKKEVSYENTFI